MSIETLISIEEYLATSYRPDVDYVDGHIEERNLGEWDHSNLQMRISAYLFSRRKQWGINVVPEQRVQVAADRFRVPDVTVIVGDPDGKILRKPPFLCIEILSPDDRMSRVQTRIQDYLGMGVAYVWILEPESRCAYIATKADGLREEKSGVLRTVNPALEVPLSEIFE